MLKVSMIGCGAIGASVLDILKNDADITITSVIVGDEFRERAQETLSKIAPHAQLVSSLSQATERPDVVVECAGHSALAEHVIPALEQGIPCVVVSIGALSDTDIAHKLEQAAKRGKTQVQLLSGAIGGIDALAAAKIGGLDSVVYTGRKPANAWKDTPADGLFDLDALTEATVIFEGSAGEAARLYPKNANVAATLSLAGVGLDATKVRLIADPSSKENVHHYEASGAFGSFELTMRGKPLAANPKTSALTVYSVVRAIGNMAHAVAI
jgi:aspartate dehydrogenase